MAKRSYGFYLRFVSSAKHHSGAVSSNKAIAINGADWPISDTLPAAPAAFLLASRFSDEMRLSGGM
ncbi:MAG: hypothetical protein E5Y88_10395 [Mesorhizobium sp.]|uniref:Transposase n=1 Tax=Mesorhizobium mediterraneum TaxID=43617 RepID=A0AB36RDR4_9HYPH|nr:MULTISPECIES: hypothetical protein [Mesorhizobium]RUU24854.1 hypothetical protein EOD08_24340 [Mesorhizobium sp. M6A.T.Ca.TU.002.02.2.1]AZO66712.1 hypothetical protein EJ075_18545 [Mesorhizobium sp. M6A.T.Cr.TU.016.01.1.1]PAQ02739.1 hypothetical protein CIT25_09010 [Mesorhizobium mediterraneum]RUU97458.1 hypothetical protein EOB36_26855 [Mesorhizobium sp. M6A.T.Cr.TU.017.01.1.1]RWN40777.1 MAG: hypothetical protein EOR96_15040 [Mesorhizobium sp.]